MNRPRSEPLRVSKSGEEGGGGGCGETGTEELKNNVSLQVVLSVPRSGCSPVSLSSIRRLV